MDEEKVRKAHDLALELASKATNTMSEPFVQNAYNNVFHAMMHEPCWASMTATGAEVMREYASTKTPRVGYDKAIVREDESKYIIDNSGNRD
jgi:hypothetical protein